MRRIISICIALGAIFSLSCTRRVVIPDDELALIFRDAFLANSYVLIESVKFDSLQVYSPIFERYGYSVEDMQYTIGNFSKRKSARLSNVVEESIKMLEREGKIYELESAILDSIDAIASRRLTRSIYFDDYIEFYNQADSMNVRLELDSLVAGSYRLSYDYLIDTLDDNRSSYRFVYWFEANEEKPERLSSSTVYLKKHSIESIDRDFTIDTLTHKFKALLFDTYAIVKSPHITIKNLNVEYTPPAAEAVDSMYRTVLDVRVFADDFFGTTTTDSLQLSTK